MLSKYPFDKHVSYFFSAEMVKRGKGWSREKEPWSPFILQPIVCLKILHFHMKAIIEKTTQKMVNCILSPHWGLKKLVRNDTQFLSTLINEYVFFSKIIPILIKKHRQSRSHKCCFNQFDSVVCFVPSRWWRL